jgi:hypothetical protein
MPLAIERNLELTQGNERMEYRILTGDERRDAIEDEGCCTVCGFRERLLVSFQREDKNHPDVQCEECFVNESYVFDENWAVAFVPELSVPALSHFCRAAAWYSFTSRIGFTITANDLSGGMPSDFANKKAWERPIQPVTPISEAFTSPANDARKLAREAYRFLNGRIGVASKRLDGDLSLKDKIEKAGLVKFKSDYRIIPLSITAGRLRSWGKEGATFHSLACSKQKTQ